MTASERWRPRSGEFRRALELFRRTDALRAERPLSEAEEAGLVQFFELTVELGWKTLAALLDRDGLVLDVVTPMAVVRSAFRAGLIEDGDRWAAAIRRRNIMAHVYDVNAFRALIADAATEYLPAFDALAQRLDEA